MLTHRHKVVNVTSITRQSLISFYIHCTIASISIQSSHITGPRKMRVSPGATLTLECSVSPPLTPSGFFWQHNGRVISPGRTRNTDRGGRLVIVDVATDDAGTYGCYTDVTTPALVEVFVGKKKLFLDARARLLGLIFAVGRSRELLFLLPLAFQDSGHYTTLSLSLVRRRMRFFCVLFLKTDPGRSLNN